MFGFIARGIASAFRAVKRVFRKVTGIGPDNLPDALSVFTICTRVAVVALGCLALIATIIPALSADPVAIRLLSASHSLWDAGTRAGFESRYEFPAAGRAGDRMRGIEGRSGRSVSVYDLDDDDDVRGGPSSWR